MTFAEELKNISDVINFEVNIATDCALIKDKMREAASLGIRSFQIDIIKLFPNCGLGRRDTVEDNYYTIVTAKNIPINNYKDKIVEYLTQQGFSVHSIDIAHIRNNYYCSCLITARW